MNTINKSNQLIVSTNIERDVDTDIQYIVTKNSQDVFNNILSDFQTGMHSFTIIGSYGTGKSTFLWALEKNLTAKKNLFQFVDETTFVDVNNFHFFKLIGEANSLKKSFEIKLGVSSEEDIFEKLTTYYQQLQEKNEALVIVIDEFGKFLEYSAIYNPDEELYFIQQLAEFCNDPTKNILFITTLHQNFNTYASSLTTQQKNEWTKVKGRLKELAFNEPIDQLLFFVKKRIKQLDFDSVKSVNFDKITNLIENSKLTDPHRTFESVEELYPFDYLAIEILTKALQKYGQNERSLFSFLDSNDTLAIRSFSREGDIYSLGNVALFLEKNFKTSLGTKDNPDFSQWTALKIAIEITTNRLSSNYINDAILLLKVINLITIFTNKGGEAGDDFLINYSKLVLNIQNSEKIIELLKEDKIIKYIDYNRRYIFSNGTDYDVEEEIRNAGQKVNPTIDVVKNIKPFFEFPYVAAKSITYERGTPRFFKYELSSKPIETFNDKQEIDGIINLIFSEDEILPTIKEQPILYAVYHEFQLIKQVLYEIDKINYVLSHCDTSDKVARRELEERKNHEVLKLNSLIIEKLYDSSTVSWFYNGEKINIKSSKFLTIQLSKICREIYLKTPIFRNESVNKHKISTAISTARKSYEIALLENADKEDLGFPKDKFPPEKAIYLTLLQKTGIHTKIENDWSFSKPKEISFQFLWEKSEEFLKESIGKKNNLSKFIQKLTQRPLKLKKGFLDFWIPTFLIIKQEDFALFNEVGYIPNITSEVLTLIYKSPEKFSIKAFNVSNVNIDLFKTYQSFLKQGNTTTELNLETKTQSTLISTIRPFIVFYRSLPTYTQKTKQLSPAAHKIREAISNAEDLENVLFEKFPKALGYNITLNDTINLEDYTKNLENTIRELRMCFEYLIDRIEECILFSLNIQTKEYEKYKEIIFDRFKTINKQKLIPQQRTLLQRLIAPIDKKNDWIKGIANVIVERPLDKIHDEEEAFICNNLIEMLQNLETSIDIHVLQKSHVNDEVISFDIVTSKGKKESSKIIIPTDKSLDKEIKVIQKTLSQKSIKEQKAIIAKIFQNILENE